MRTLFLLIKNDLWQGILCRWKFFLISFLYFIFVDFIFVIQTNRMFADTDIQFGISDILLNMFLGNEAFDPSTGKGINIAINFIIFHTLLFSSIGFYLAGDLKKSATQIILRTNSRTLWWISKTIWCIALVIAYYSLFLICAIFFGLFFGDFTFYLNTDIASTMFELNVQGVSIGNTIFVVILLPVVISIFAAIFSSVISLVVKPIFSLILVACYLIASAFYESPALLFNYSMIMRNNFVGVWGLPNQCGMFIAVALSLISFAVGIIVIKNKDIF